MKDGIKHICSCLVDSSHQKRESLKPWEKIVDGTCNRQGKQKMEGGRDGN